MVCIICDSVFGVKLLRVSALVDLLPGLSGGFFGCALDTERAYFADRISNTLGSACLARAITPSGSKLPTGWVTMAKG